MEAKIEPRLGGPADDPPFDKIIDGGYFRFPILMHRLCTDMCTKHAFGTIVTRDNPHHYAVCGCCIKSVYASNIHYHLNALEIRTTTRNNVDSVVNPMVNYTAESLANKYRVFIVYATELPADSASVRAILRRYRAAPKSFRGLRARSVLQVKLTPSQRHTTQAPICLPIICPQIPRLVNAVISTHAASSATRIHPLCPFASSPLRPCP